MLQDHTIDEIKIFYDGTNIDKYYKQNEVIKIKGFTTNPTLLNKGNLNTKIYSQIATNMLQKTDNLPVSFEVFADDETEMIEQARIISSWDSSIYVKIPIVNTRGKYMTNVITTLNNEGVKLNITAIFTEEQIFKTVRALTNTDVPTIISVFAGRIDDTGYDAKIIVKYAVDLIKEYPAFEILWASIREVKNIYDAISVKCDIITVTDSVMDKLKYIGKDLTEFSIETVEMFYKDGQKSGINFSTFD